MGQTQFVNRVRLLLQIATPVMEMFNNYCYLIVDIIMYTILASQSTIDKFIYL